MEASTTSTSARKGTRPELSDRKVASIVTGWVNQSGVMMLASEIAAAQGR